MEQKISFRVSLFWAVVFLLFLLFLAFFLQGYFNFKLSEDAKIETEIIQKQLIAETMAQMLHSPLDFSATKSLIDGLKEMPEMKTLVFFRVIYPSGDIFCSTINQEIGRRIENFKFPESTLIENANFQEKPITAITAASYFKDIVVQMGFSTQDLAENKNAFFRFLVSDILFFGLIAFCFMVLFRIVIKPIKELTGLFSELRIGRLTTKNIETDIKEINELTVAFNETISDIKDYKKEIEGAKEILEIKVMARTKELEALTATLEEKINDRTKELQSKVEELEKFQKLAVGREIKMIEQKKELQEIKDKLKQNENTS
jgi:methyl-accepting chemotaxis protein